MKDSLLLVFVKYPEPGRVKTRLATDAGAVEAAAIYEKMVFAVLDGIPSDQPIRVCYDAFRSEADYRDWLDHPLAKNASFSAQCAGDLGDRLCLAFASAFEEGWRKVGVIGSDCLELTAPLYEETWKKLDSTDVVIGPTFDGGYYLLAMRHFQPGLFAGIHWSSEVVYKETLAAAKVSRLSVDSLPTLHDIDTFADWNSYGLTAAKSAD